LIEPAYHPIGLVQVRGNHKTSKPPDACSAVQLYLPVYRPGLPHDTIQDRRHNLAGFVHGEGVETQEELEHMRREGCTEAQGYFFSRSRPAKDVYTLLAQQAGNAEAVA
jgi:hypothetical protein